MAQVEDSAALPAAAPAKGAPEMVAGITIQHVDLEHVMKQLGMTREEIETIMAPNATWPHAGHQDGWKMSHDAIRFDMDNYLAAIEKTKDQVCRGTPLAAWQAAAFRAISASFYHSVHSHHEHEEAIFFPWMQKRVQLPVKMSADHKTLMAQLDRVRDLCGGLKAGGSAQEAQATFEELHSVFVAMRDSMRCHLEEEEIEGLPMLRKHFTGAEFAVTEKKIIATMTPADMAWFLRPLPLAGKVETMTRFEIPGLVQKLVMLPAVKKDEASVLKAYRELAAGEQEPAPRRRGLFACLSG